MLVHVLLYDSGNDTEGIHSLELSGKTIVLMFENRDDAERYCVLLEAQDFPSPSVEQIDKEEIELFCDQAGYEARLVENGFIPKSQEDRFNLVPPEANRDTSHWKENTARANEEGFNEQGLEDIRNRLEGLL